MKGLHSCVESAGFLGLALVVAHVVSWLTDGMQGLYAYPVVWLLLIVVLAVDGVAKRKLVAA